MKPRDRLDPDAGRQAALAQYRRRAGIYDLELAAFEPIRRSAVAALQLQPGDVVLDLGCGTGLSLDLLRQGVGPSGRVIGVEQSPEMIAKARQRASQQHWGNVSLLCSPVQSARLRGHANAALFHFTHDILRDPQALAHVVSHLAPGATVVAVGLRWAPPWAVLTNLFVWGAALHSVTSLEGLAQPWSELARLIGCMQVQSLLTGGAYLAVGRVAPQA